MIRKRGAALGLLLALAGAGAGTSKAGYDEDMVRAKEQLAVGKQRQQAGDCLTAITLFKQAIENDPNLWEAYYMKGLCHYQRGEVDDAISALEQAKEQHPELAKEVDKFLEKLKVESLGGTYYEAGSQSEQANKLLDKAKEAWDAGRKDEAGSLIAGALRADPNLPSVNFAAGYFYQKHKGDLNSAEVFYQQAVALKPDYVEALNNLGVVYLEKGYYDRAIYQFRKVIELDYKKMEAYFNLAEAQARKGEYALAAEEMVKVIAENEGDIAAHNNLALYYEETGNVTDAMKEWAKVVEIGSDAELKSQAQAHLDKMKIYQD